MKTAIFTAFVLATTAAVAIIAGLVMLPAPAPAVTDKAYELALNFLAIDACFA